jgi:hypothetical protein
VCVSVGRESARKLREKQQFFHSQSSGCSGLCIIVVIVVCSSLDVALRVCKLTHDQAGGSRVPGETHTKRKRKVETSAPSTRTRKESSLNSSSCYTFASLNVIIKSLFSPLLAVASRSSAPRPPHCFVWLSLTARSFINL